MRHIAIAALSFLVIVSPRVTASTDAYRDDVSLDTYLDMLSRIAPAAREGAEAYLHAFKARCGRDMTTVELRWAVADGEGDPVLLGMMRAVARGDEVMLRALAGRVNCPRGG
jgi:hypothetical protein